jgi:hypothetical protein
MTSAQLRLIAGGCFTVAAVLALVGSNLLLAALFGVIAAGLLWSGLRGGGGPAR